MMEQIRIAIVYCSRYGHTRAVAEAVGRGAGKLADVKLYTTVEAVEKMAELNAADAIVLGSPTYMGNMASEMKVFLEATVGCWVSRAWSDKIAGGFTNSSNFSGDKLNTLQGMMITCMQLGMIWVGLNTLPGENDPEAEKTVDGPSPECLNRNSASLGPMASSFNVRVPDAPPAGDIATAERYGERIATVTVRFKRGA
jgi:flavodoxin/nitric oxide synthase